MKYKILLIITFNNLYFFEISKFLKLLNKISFIFLINVNFNQNNDFSFFKDF